MNLVLQFYDNMTTVKQIRFESSVIEEHKKITIHQRMNAFSEFTLSIK